ncbi:MAG: glycosyltransferase family 9 protein, partial [Vicinamibacterales bacterium]
PIPSIELPPLVHDVPTLPESYAAIYPATGAYSKAREWFRDRYGRVAQHLSRLGLRPVIVGGEDAVDAARIIEGLEPSVIDLTGTTTLSQLAHILDSSRIVVGGDSFVGHLAAALGRPTVSIFGPSNAKAWRPSGSLDHTRVDHHRPGQSLVVRHDVPCAPCVYTGFRLGRPAGCPDRTCLKLVTVADVNTAISAVLGVA